MRGLSAAPIRPAWRPMRGAHTADRPPRYVQAHTRAAFCLLYTRDYRIMIVVESVVMDYEWSGEDDMSESVEQYWDAVKT